MYSIILLDSGPVIIGRVRFIGAMSWTDSPLHGVAEERGARHAALKICDFDGSIEHRGGLFTTHNSSRRYTKGKRCECTTWILQLDGGLKFQGRSSWSRDWG